MVMAFIKTGYNIFRYVVFASIVYLLLLLVVIFLASNTIGIEVQLSTAFMGICLLVFGLVGWLFTQQSSFKLFGRTLTKNTTTVAICGMLIISGVGLCIIRFFVHTNVIVGITWYDCFYNDQKKIKAGIVQAYNDGFKAIRVNYVAVVMPSMKSDGDELYWRVLTCFQTASFYKMSVMVITPTYSTQSFEDYVTHFGSYVDVWQLTNELDLIYWAGDNGTKFPYFTDELVNIVANLRHVISKCDDSFKTIVTFSSAYELRVDLVAMSGRIGVNGIEAICSDVDYVGFDTYGFEGQAIRPYAVSYLQSLSQKPLWITEIGYSTRDAQAKADYIITGLDFAKRNGIECVYVHGWGNDTYYGIRDTPAETAIAKWIGDNA